MVQVLEGKGSVIGRIGKGFAEGLAEQVPKEIERYRLSSGLKKLEGQNLTPIQQYSTLIQSGATPDQVAQILPLLERAQSNAEAKRFAEEGRKAQPVTSAGAGQRAITPQAQPQAVQVNAQGQPVPPRNQLITATGEQARLNPVLPLTIEEQRARGAELHAQYPNRFKTQQEGEAEAARERQSQIDTQNALINQSQQQKAIRSELESGVSQRLGTLLQNQEGLPSLDKVTGKYYQQIIDEEDANVANGTKTTQQASEDAAKKLRDFADLRLKNETQGAKSWLGKSAKGVKSQLKSLREGYEKLGQLDTFYNDIIANHNLTPAHAAAITYPISDNKSLSHWIDKAKSISSVGEFFGDNPKSEQYARKKAAQLPQYLNPTDSLLAIASALQDKNISGETFLDEVRSLKAQNKISLTDKQIKELENTGSLVPSIGDWFLKTMGNL